MANLKRAVTACFIPILAILIAGRGTPTIAEGPSPQATGTGTIEDIGVYWAGPESYAKLKTLSAHLITSNFANDTLVRLYWAERNDVQLILFNSAWVDDSVAGGRANTTLICDNIESVKGHAALWGYYVIDEPSKHVYASGNPNPTSLATMQTVYKTIKRCDPDANTVAVFLPGGGFGSASNNFGPDIADNIMFDTYFKAPDGNHFEWITDTVLPNAIKTVKARDPGAKLWAAFQTFGVNSSSSRITIPSRPDVQKQIDLTIQVHQKLSAPLAGALFFLWDSNFDSDDSELNDDLRSHRDYWSLVQYAADRLPPVTGSTTLPDASLAGSPLLMPSKPERVEQANVATLASTEGLVPDRLCTEPQGTGVIDGDITQVRAADGNASIGSQTFEFDGSTNVIAFTQDAQRLSPAYIQRGAFVKVYPQKGETLKSAPACKVLVKPINNLKFTVLQVVKRTNLLFDGVVLTVREGHLEVNSGIGTAFDTIEIDGDLATQLSFTNPPGTPEVGVAVENLWRGTLIQVIAGFIGGSPTNLVATEMVVLPNNSGSMEITGPAVNGRFPVASLESPPLKIKTIKLADKVDLYFTGKDGDGKNVQIALPRTAVQPDAKFTFIGRYDDAPGNFLATVGYQVPVTYDAIVTDTLNGGLTLKVMGPEFMSPDTAVITLSLAGAQVVEQLDNGSTPTTPTSKISDYSTVLLTGYWTAVKTFKVTRAVFFYMAPPAPQ